MKSPLLLIALWLMTFTLTAQEGYFFHSHFSPIKDSRDQYYFDMDQDDQGGLLFASRMGLLYFDGRHWDRIATPGPVFSIARLRGATYVCGTGGLGEVVTDPFGNLQYRTLNDTSLNLTRLVATDSTLVMTDGRQVLTYAPASGQWTVQLFTDRITHLLNPGSELLVQTSAGLKTIQDSAPAAAFWQRKNAWILAAPSPDAKQYALATEAGNLHLWDGNKATPLPVEDDGYLAESVVLAARWIRPDLLAIGTLRGGVVFVNPGTGKIVQIVNYHTGLPDNEVHTLFEDMDGALWVTHAYGATRIAPELPLRTFNFYPGLSGTIQAVRLQGGAPMVSTNLGVYYLDQVRNFDEITIYVKKSPEQETLRERSTGFFGSLFNKKRDETTQEEVPAERKRNKAKPAESATTSSTTTQEETQDDRKRRPLNLFGKKNKTEAQEPVAITKAPTPTTTTTAPTARESKQYEKKVVRELQSITYLYRKVPGIDGHIGQLIPIDAQRMIGAGLEGVFVIEGKKAREIMDEAARFAWYSTGKKQLFVAGHDGTLTVLTPTADARWNRTVLLSELEENIESILEDTNGRLWLASARHVYWLEVKGTEITNAGEMNLPNEFLDPVAGVVDDSLGIVWVHHRGFFRVSADSLVQFSLGSLDAPVRYVATPEGILVSDGRRWHSLGQRVAQPTAMTFLSVFPNIISLDKNAQGALWVVNSDNRLYKINDVEQVASDYFPFLKQIRAINTLLPIRDELEVEQAESSLIFHFNQPEFSGIFQVDYRYRLVGLNDTWSEWSANYHTIEFPYLPNGKYELQVQTRNIFGTEKSLEPVYFRVIPPYWQRPWFYALEILFFGGLFYLSISLSKTQHARLQILNRLLAFLTIIMFIEFLQTAIQSIFGMSMSPVLEFFMQVTIAMTLLPLESFMRKKFFKDNSEMELKSLMKEEVSKIKSTIKKGISN